MRPFFCIMKTNQKLFNVLAIGLFLFARSAHSAPGDLYVAEPTSGNVYKFTPAGNKSTFASGIYQPVALAFDRAGNLFVGNSGSGFPQMPTTVVRIAPNGTQSVFATIKSNALDGMAFDGAGNLFVSAGSSIIKIAPDGTQTTFASQLSSGGIGVGCLAFDSSANLCVALGRSILKLAPDGTQSVFVTLPAGSSATAFAFGTGGDLFVVKNGVSILRISPSGTSTTFATLNRYCSSLAFDAALDLLAGQDAYNTSEPGILKFTKSGTATTFASGVLLPSGFAFEPVTEKLRNLSARGLVANGESVLIGGFIVGGSVLSNNAVVVRAIGPSLSRSGVSNPLSDPVLELHDSSGAIIASNNDWQDTQKAQITASGLAPTDSRESAIFATLPAGNYTAVVLSGDHTTGIALVEVYSVSQ